MTSHDALKNPIVYGSPGAGKSYVGSMTVLYTLSQGLNIISTALMALRAQALGGLHLQEIFKLPTSDGASIAPFAAANQAIQKIERKTHLHYALLTADVIFLDEAGQVSSEQLAIIDIILRKMRGSQIPFGGVLIICTMDQRQLQPIKAIPFLVSSFMLTSFVAIELTHSVRAHGYPKFKRLQDITRMDPHMLRESPELEAEFKSIAKEELLFVRDWDDDAIGPNMMQTFSRRIPAKEALDKYRESIKRKLDRSGKPYILANSRDTQIMRGANGDFTPANEQSIRALNKELREPSELILFSGGVYELTVNDMNRGFSQSQTAFLLELPSIDDVQNHAGIQMWIAPPAACTTAFDMDNLPTNEELSNAGWKHTFVGCAPERDVNVRGGMRARRMQYSLKHIGATTINKSMGSTLPHGIAVEISKKYSPWEAGQVVVLLSCSLAPKLTVIVGCADGTFAVNNMWELITIGNQWTMYSSMILNAITGNGNDIVLGECTFDYPKAYPFRKRDAELPTDTTGYVYCLFSQPKPHLIYIGETQCLAQRYNQHQTGRGSAGTRNPSDRPWVLAAYISGMAHMTTRGRMSVEKSWKEEVRSMKQRGIDDSHLWILAGERVAARYNMGCTDQADHILFVPMIERK